MALTAEQQPAEVDIPKTTTTRMEKVNDDETKIKKKNTTASTMPPPPSSPGRKKTEVLMRMIAQEMVSSFFGEDDGASVKDEQELVRALKESTKKELSSGKSSRRKRKDGSRRKSSSRRSGAGSKNKIKAEDPINVMASTGISGVSKEQTLEDLYYAHINGGEPSNVLSDAAAAANNVLIKGVNNIHDGMLDVQGSFGQESFAGLDLGLDGFHEEEDRLRSHTFHSKSSRSSCSSSGSDTFDTDDEEDEDEDNESEPISVDEIRNHVMEQMPQALRDQIPAEAWNHIFGSISSATSSSSKSDSSSSKQGFGEKPKQQQQRRRRTSNDKNDLLAIKDKLVISDIPVSAAGGGAGSNDRGDDVSECSDLTGLTGAFTDSPIKGPKGKRWSIGNSTEATELVSEYDDEVACPASNPSLLDSLDPRPVQPQRRAYSDNLIDPRAMLSPGRSPSSSGSAPVAPCSRRSQSSGDSGSRRTRVSFSEVQVRQYERILSDNPACQSGPSLGIGWKYNRAGIIDVDSYESKRGIPRNHVELTMPRHVRENILKDWGYEQKDVADMVRNILKVKNQRRQTINNLGAADMEEAVENAKRKVKSILTFGMKKDMIKSSSNK